MVAPAVGGIPEVVDHNNGLLVPSRDVAALAEALEKVMETRYDRKGIAERAAAIYGYAPVGAALEALEAFEARNAANT